ncbi:MAG: hypothetical protein AAF772_04520 [Acidobacteriota bacterium]
MLAWNQPDPCLTDAPTPITFHGEETPSCRALVFTIHDGDQIPRALLGRDADAVLVRPDVLGTYFHERDWGANLVARCLAEVLDLGGYLRVNLARVLLDFGRFPTSLDGDAAYLLRSAIYPPLRDVLTDAARHRLITHHYDEISRALTGRFLGKILAIDVHTYDPVGRNGIRRPEVSLVTRSMGYQRYGQLPRRLFDPLFPAALCEDTCHPALSCGIVADLARSGRYATLNYPYVMPEGSVEVRALVWFFFRHVREAFEHSCPETVGQKPYEIVWDMLLDVTQRLARAAALRGFLHAYLAPPPGVEQLFADARDAYATIAAFVHRHHGVLVNDYRHALNRLGCLGVEVRKDLLVDLDPAKRRLRLRADAEETARQIAGEMARSIRQHLDDAAQAPPLLSRVGLADARAVSPLAEARQRDADAAGAAPLRPAAF